MKDDLLYALRLYRAGFIETFRESWAFRLWMAPISAYALWLLWNRVFG